MEDYRSRLVGLFGTLLFHLLVIFLLWMGGITSTIPQEEQGMEVMFGNDVVEASGHAIPKPLIANATPQEVVSPPTRSEKSTPVVTQNNEESIAMLEQKKKIAEEQRKEMQKQAEERAKAEAERNRIADEQKRAADISKKISGAFGRGGQVGSSGTSANGKGFQGSSNGNSTTGAVSGVGGIGSAPSYVLKGRTSVGALPRPTYNDQVEGVIVVEIVVSPEGKVLSADIDISRTSIASRSMRDGARRAALQTHFNSMDSNENQIGSITYVYKFAKQ